MLKKIKSNIKHLNNPSSKKKTKELTYSQEEYQIDKSLEVNLLNLKRVFAKSSDIVYREFKIGIKKQIKAFLCFIDGLVDKETLNDHIIRALAVDFHLIGEDIEDIDIYTAIKENILSVSDIKEINSFNEVVSLILDGEVALFLDNYDIVFMIDIKGWASRSITEPETEVGIRGSHEGFTETLRVNTSLLRRIIKNTKLTFETYRLGKETSTEICIAYIEGIADKKIVDEVKSRINKINADSILESGYVEQYISDHPLSIFSTVGNSEKPEKVAAKMLEGRVAILCSGTPVVLTVPFLFIENFQVSEDYYDKPVFASFERILRLFAFLISTFLPALYISLETFHQEMIPSILLSTMAAAREGIPFPAFIETLFMITTFELLRQSGLRMPRQVGSAVSIVGALVIGESAVKAGLISNPMIIIAGFTGVASQIIPSIANAVNILRYIFIILSAAFGFYGMEIGIIMLLAYMCSLESFGVPYLLPLSPIKWEGLKDCIIRFPLWLIKLGSKSITYKNSRK